LRKYFPDLWQHMKELDEKCIKQIGYPFRPNCSIADLDARFERDEELENELLKDMEAEASEFLELGWDYWT